MKHNNLPHPPTPGAGLESPKAGPDQTRRFGRPTRGSFRGMPAPAWLQGGLPGEVPVGLLKGRGGHNVSNSCGTH